MKVVIVCLAVVATLALWRVNSNKLGMFYDYSIIASGVGRLEQGQQPYKDFSTPVQSLTIRYGELCERLFGPRYMSLAYGNLILAFLALAVIFGLARPAFGDWEALLYAITILT